MPDVEWDEPTLFEDALRFGVAPLAEEGVLADADSPGVATEDCCSCEAGDAGVPAAEAIGTPTLLAPGGECEAWLTGVAEVLAHFENVTGGVLLWDGASSPAGGVCGGIESAGTCQPLNAGTAIAEPATVDVFKAFWLTR